MPHASWPLINGQPVIEIEFEDKFNGSILTRTLLVDTGGGSALVPVDLVLSVADVTRCRVVFKVTSVREAPSKAHLKSAQSVFLYSN